MTVCRGHGRLDSRIGSRSRGFSSHSSVEGEHLLGPKPDSSEGSESDFKLCVHLYLAHGEKADRVRRGVLQTHSGL